MIRLTLLAALVVAGCHPTSAEVRCGPTLCNSNQRCEPKNLVCVLDEAPHVLIDEPRGGSLIAGDTLILSGSVRDDNGATTLELSLDEGKTWVRVPASSDHFSARVGLPSMDYQPLGLTLRAHDSLQQASLARVAITVDNIAPLVTVGSPIEGATLNAAWFSASHKVSGLAADGSGLSSLSVDVGEGEVALTPIGDQFAFDWVARPGDDGIARKAQVTAVDLAGNRTVVSRQVRVDVVPPQLSFTVPAADALLGPAFFLGGGLVKGQVSAGATVTADFGNGPQTAMINEGGWSVAYTPAIGLDFQKQLLEVIATDEAGNQARALRITTVDLVAPILTFTGPAQGARLNAADFPTGNDLAVEWTVKDGDPQVAVRNGASTIAGSSLKVATSPTDNPMAYAVSLNAQDRAGNSSQAQLSFSVDRLRPTVTRRTPDVDSRNVSTTVEIHFSEAVTGAEGLTLTPPAIGTWITATDFEVKGLAADAVFSSVVGPVVDAFGNPVASSAPVKFHTAPSFPASGTTLMMDVAQFKAAADPDGVLTLFTTSTPPALTYRWVRVNPKTGVVEDNRMPWTQTLGADLKEVAAFAEARVEADLSARRVSAATTLIQWNVTERHAFIRIADGPATKEFGMVGVIPAPAFAGEPTGLGEVGFLKFVSGQALYARTGMSDLALGMGAPTAMGFASDRWEMIEVRNQVFKHRTFGCSAAFPNAPPSCGLSAVGQWTDVSTTDETSYAISDRCSVYIYNTTTGMRRMRFEPYVPTSCAGRICPTPTFTDLVLSSELRIASDRRKSNTFVGASRDAAGKVQLRRLPLDPNCQGGFTDVGAPIAVPLGRAFEPVSLGGKPALLYVDSAYALKVYVP